MNVLSAWLLTYAVHSTILLGATWLACRWIANEAWRDWLWKAALLGGVATASVAATTSYRPLLGRWTASDVASTLAAPLAGVRSEAPPLAPGSGPDAKSPPPRPEFEPGRTRTALPMSTAGRDPQAGRDVRWGEAVQLVLLSVWAVGAGLLLVRIATGHARLLRQLAPRRRVAEGPDAEYLAGLRRGSGRWVQPKLTQSDACPTPIAMGRREICLPSRFAGRLPTPEREAALAHEFAHIVRRDPRWQMVAAIVESAFFFQPLNRTARREIRRSAEHLADDWAAEATGQPMNLARCLTEVRAWTGTAEIPSPTVAMAEGGSALVHRVERLASWSPTPTPGPVRRALVAAAAISVIAWAAPSAASTARIQAALPLPAGGVAGALGPTEAPRAAEPPDTVVRHPNPAAPLRERWRWGRAADPAEMVWIGWGVRVRARAGGVPNSSTPGARASDRDDPIDAYLPELAGRSNLMVMAFLARGADPEAPLEQAILRDSNAPVDMAGRGLIWLGEAESQESLALLADLSSVSADTRVRREIAAAMLSHDTPDAVLDYASSLLADESDAGTRAEAVQWLGRHPFLGARAVPLLARLAFTDPSAAVQGEATDALAALLRRAEPAARDALLDIADRHTSLGIRSEALQALARQENEAPL